MLNNEFLQDVSKRISRLTPMAAGAREELEKNVQEVLNNAFKHLNLVTREEFDAQTKVLARAEQTVAALEEKVATLEKAREVSPAGDRDSGRK